MPRSDRGNGLLLRLCGSVSLESERIGRHALEVRPAQGRADIGERPALLRLRSPGLQESRTELEETLPTELLLGRRIEQPGGIGKESPNQPVKDRRLER